MYPRGGDLVRVTVHQARRDKVVVGRVVGEERRPSKALVRCFRSGFVGGTIETEGGKRVSVPWTSDRRVVEYQILEPAWEG